MTQCLLGLDSEIETRGPGHSLSFLFSLGLLGHTGLSVCVLSPTQVMLVYEAGGIAGMGLDPLCLETQTRFLAGCSQQVGTVQLPPLPAAFGLLCLAFSLLWNILSTASWPDNLVLVLKFTYFCGMFSRSWGFRLCSSVLLWFIPLCPPDLCPRLPP